MVIVLGSQVIYYEHTQGRDGARPLILLHGNGEDHHIFDTLTAALGDEYEVYAPDTRGHGMSACPEELHYSDMADDLCSFITELTIDRPLIAGFSDGAITALILATTHSDMISGIISCGANTSPKALSLSERAQIKKTYKKKISSKKSFEKTLDTISSEIFAETGALEKLMLTEPDISDIALSRISVPVLVLAGKNDIVRESDTKKIFSSIPTSDLHILPDEDHGSYVVNSDKLKPYIEGFDSFF